MRVVEGVADVDDVGAFVERLGSVGEEYGVTVQAFDARYVVGREHLARAVELADRAFVRGENVARERSVEVLLYAAGRRQIDRALAMGVDEGETPVVVVVDSPDGSGDDDGDREAAAAEAVRDLLVDRLGVSAEAVYERPAPLDFRDFAALADLDRPDLRVASWTPRGHPRLTGEADIFSEIDRGDVLVHHPYHSFEDTVQRFLWEAANDPDVLAIKCAIYRTARDSQVLESLIEAARNGKQVAVMVELQARFDEENNLRWVRRLEEEGIHVAYGAVGYKAHSKVALVVREQADGVRLYSHVGTGNYHAGTARNYADLGVLTADQDVGQDLARLFNFFTGHSLQREYRKLLVAPANLRERFVELVRNEAAHGADGRIVAKMNALEDPWMVRELYEASRAGVDVDLLVRGVCRLRPGLDGVSENVRVHSVVGRFLEHSRVFHFAHDDPGWYVGSADWMTRNLDRRVEAVLPVESPEHQQELRFVLDTMLSDNRRRWVMDSEGEYEQLRPADDEAVVDTHEVLMERARDQAPPHPATREFSFDQ